MYQERVRISEIKIAIEQVVGNTRYSSWTIGITDDPDRRRGEHARANKVISKFLQYSHLNLRSEDARTLNGEVRSQTPLLRKITA